MALPQFSVKQQKASADLERLEVPEEHKIIGERLGGKVKPEEALTRIKENFCADKLSFKHHNHVTFGWNSFSFRPKYFLII